MKLSIGAKIFCVIFLIFFYFPVIAFSEGEWAEQNGNIYNTNSGNVGLGTTSPNSILHIDGSDQIRLSRSGDNTWRLFTTNSGSGGLAIRDETATEYRMFFSEDGNVGIGTTSPDSILHIDGSDQIRLSRSGDNTWRLFTTNSGSGGLAIRDETATKYRMFFSEDGNVGIGATSPSTKLQINDSTTDDNDILTLNQQNGYASGGRNFIRFTQGTDTLGLNARLGFDYDSYGIQFRNSNDDPTVTVTNNGNVGIGSTSPGAKLEVMGGNIKIESSDNYTRLQLWNSGGGRHYQLLSGSNGLFGIYDMTSTDWRLSVRPNGNVGIGTNTPQSKLAVNGTISAKEVKVTNTGWSDFVFDEKYDLPTLNKVESFIKQNKHLPDIPSTKEVKEQGLAVSEMLAKQMQKIEEMTLYLIQLKNENDQLKERVALLERSNKATVK